MRRLSNAIAAAILILLPVLAALATGRQPLLIESLESRTLEGSPVFNRIAFFPGWNRDVWMMQQSHHGVAAASGQWDRLAIVVDRSATPRVARFYQLEPGELTPSAVGHAREVPYRAACFMCHSNGPRVVRPRPDALSPTERLEITTWNLRIKTYGRLLAEAGHPVTPGTTPFRYAGDAENEPLRAAACIRCHNESWWGRGTLTRQNFMAIGFMVSQGQMPPPGFGLKPEEKRAILLFTRGLGG